MPKKRYIKVKRRLLVFGTISFIVVVFCSINILNYYHATKKLLIEQKELLVYLELLEKEEETLKDELIKLSDPNYVARYAREKYLYSKEGEIIIVLP